MRPAPRRPGKSSTWSVRRAPAESTNQKTGSSCSSAYSVRRTIFSTVRAPHDPAFTVGSFAITHTGRPSTVPTPVTTPSAGRSPASALARSALSTKEPSSRSSASRSRTNSFPCRSSLAPSFSRLPWSARSAAARNSSLISCRSRCCAPGRSAPCSATASLRAGVPGSRTLRSCRCHPLIPTGAVRQSSQDRTEKFLGPTGTR
jgi:hypothetical protein